MPLIGTRQGQQNWWTKGLGGSRRTLRNWTGGRTTAKSVAQEGRKVKPISPPTPSHFTDRKTSRTDLTTLKPADDFFFFFSLLLPFCPSFFFYSFFLPFFAFLFLLPSLLSYSFSFPPFFFFILLSTGETIKPRAMKRPELYPNRGILITEIVRQISLCYSRELARWGR